MGVFNFEGRFAYAKTIPAVNAKRNPKIFGTTERFRHGS